MENHAQILDTGVWPKMGTHLKSHQEIMKNVTAIIATIVGATKSTALLGTETEKVANGLFMLLVQKELE